MDASDYAVAVILSTVTSDSEVHPIAFHSCTLGISELNYDTHDKELLTIFEAFTAWRHYLEGSETPVNVITDHKNLEYFSMVHLLTRHQARWSEFLSVMDLVLDANGNESLRVRVTQTAPQFPLQSSLQD